MTIGPRPVALITGASAGLGKDFSLRLLAEGYVVYGAARRLGLMGQIREAGGIPLEMDVTEDSALVRAVERILAEQGRIDLLVNNAGYGEMGALEDVPMDAARRQMEVNLIGAARLIQLCLPHMRARRTGRIVNISSIGGKCAFPLGGWYHASKFALEGYSDSLRMEVRPFGIDVVVIEPGGTESEWMSIAHDRARRHSAEGAYGGMLARFLGSASWDRAMPAASTVSDVLVKAIRARKPRTRYPGGAMAGVILFLRRILSDRLYDRLILSQLR